MKSLLISMIAVILTVTAATAEVVRPMARPIVEECPETGNENQCMRCAIYHEARGEHIDGQIAVALVVMNRVASPRYPDTICEVVWQKGYVSRIQRWIGQFSFTTDGASDTMHERDVMRHVDAAIQVAQILYDYNLEEEYLGMNKGVLWYHTEAVSPAWAKVYHPVIMIGTHMFYSDPD